MNSTASMNVLILGASSQIGHDLALRFSANNSLILLGRQSGRLNDTAAHCLLAGALQVEVVVHDLSDGVDTFFQEVSNKKIDLVINLVATTSRIKDSEFQISQLEKYVLSDLLVPLRLIEILALKSLKPIKIIFISTILASIPSPERRLYGSLKMLQEICLNRISKTYKNIDLLVVNVGMVVPHERLSQKSANLASAIFNANLKAAKVLNYGIIGRLYVLLFYLQPLAFLLVTRMQRMLRKR